jgi:hypothetical protein
MSEKRSTAYASHCAITLLLARAAFDTGRLTARIVLAEVAARPTALASRCLVPRGVSHAGVWRLQHGTGGG